MFPSGRRRRPLLQQQSSSRRPRSHTAPCPATAATALPASEPRLRVADQRDARHGHAKNRAQQATDRGEDRVPWLARAEDVVDQGRARLIVD